MFLAPHPARKTVATLEWNKRLTVPQLPALKAVNAVQEWWKIMESAFQKVSVLASTRAKIFLKAALFFSKNRAAFGNLTFISSIKIIFEKIIFFLFTAHVVTKESL